MMIYIVGEGAFARELCSFVESGFSNFSTSQSVGLEDFYKLSERQKITNFVIAIGNNEYRKAAYEKSLVRSDCNLLIGTSLITSDADLGFGNVIMNNVTISNEAKLGDNCMVHGNTVIGHDCCIGDHVTLGANTFIGGHCTIGVGATIHPGVSIKNKIKVGDQATIGIGSSVIRAVKAGRVVFGNPATVIK